MAFSSASRTISPTFPFRKMRNAAAGSVGRAAFTGTYPVVMLITAAATARVAGFLPGRRSDCEGRGLLAGAKKRRRGRWSLAGAGRRRRKWFASRRGGEATMCPGTGGRVSWRERGRGSEASVCAVHTRREIGLPAKALNPSQNDRYNLLRNNDVFAVRAKTVSQIRFPAIIEGLPKFHPFTFAYMAASGTYVLYSVLYF